MSTPIRVNAINGAACPKDSDHCHYDIMHFDITVQKNDSGPPQPYYIHTWGLEDCQQLLIERVKKENCDPMFAPMYCGGQPMCLTQDFPDTVLTVPGTYRFRDKDGKPLNWDDDFAVEASPIHKEYAELWIQQQQLHCCLASK